MDGQLKTGRDVMVGALLGAEEFGFATAPLVVAGCIMMRVCHLDTCPVGVATQNPVLRERFTGKPEFVENFFMFIAEEVREYMAQLGFRTLQRGGRPGRSAGHARWRRHTGRRTGLDLTPVLHEPESAFMNQDLYCSSTPGPRSGQGARPAVDRDEPGGTGRGKPVRFSSSPISNVNRTRGHHARPRGDASVRRPGIAGRTPSTSRFDGSAGNSFGAFVPKGITLRLYGDANDYVGKGLSGGRIVVRPPDNAPHDSSPRTTSSAAT